MFIAYGITTNEQTNDNEDKRFNTCRAGRGQNLPVIGPHLAEVLSLSPWASNYPLV
jgi:hypothetical protein